MMSTCPKHGLSYAEKCPVCPPGPAASVDQNTFVKYSPLDGKEWVGPALVGEELRKLFWIHIWRYNPWTGQERDPRDMASDPRGNLIAPPGVNIWPEFDLVKPAAPVQAVTEHTTTGIKFDANKPRMELLDPYAIEQLTRVLSFGAQKYAAHNWRNGIRKGRLIAAALRHVFAYLGGEDKDPETGLSHAAHAMCCCMFLLGLEHRPDLDDRWKEVEGDKP